MHILIAELCLNRLYAIDIAASRGYYHIVKWLFEKDGDYSIQAYELASAGGYHRVLKYLASVHRDELNNHGFYRRNMYNAISESLHNAASNGHLKTVKWLVYNLPVFISANDYSTTIYTSDYNNYHSIALWLRRNRGKFNIRQRELANCRKNQYDKK
jgi:hypothetical protein